MKQSNLIHQLVSHLLELRDAFVQLEQETNPPTPMPTIDEKYKTKTTRKGIGLSVHVWGQKWVDLKLGENSVSIKEESGAEGKILNLLKETYPDWDDDDIMEIDEWVRECTGHIRSLYEERQKRAREILEQQKEYVDKIIARKVMSDI